jgi:hypothetical protein
VPLASFDPAAGAVANTWAALANTPGASLGSVEDSFVPCNIVALTATQPFVSEPEEVWSFGANLGQALILNNASQYIAINGAGVALPAGLVVDITIEWTEF